MNRDNNKLVLVIPVVCLIVGLGFPTVVAKVPSVDPPNQCYYAEAGKGDGYYRCDFTLQGCAWVDNKEEDMVEFSDGCYVVQE